MKKYNTFKHFLNVETYNYGNSRESKIKLYQLLNYLLDNSGGSEEDIEELKFRISSLETELNIIDSDISDLIEKTDSTNIFVEAIHDYTLRLTDDLTRKADLVGGKVPASQLPTYLDDIIEGRFIDNTHFEEDQDGTYVPIIGEKGKLYVDTTRTDHRFYRWSGNSYILSFDGGKYTPNDDVSIKDGSDYFIYLDIQDSSRRQIINNLSFEGSNGSINLAYTKWGIANTKQYVNIPRVTTNTDGVMSYIDKLKLESITVTPPTSIIYRNFSTSKTINRTESIFNEFTSMIGKTGKYKISLITQVQPVETNLTLSGVSGIETILTVYIIVDNVKVKTINASILNSGNLQYLQLNDFIDLNEMQNIQISAKVGSTDSDLVLPDGINKTFTLELVQLV